MDDVLGYGGSAVVVTGAASGLGAATAQILVDLGAEVTAVDIKPTDVAVFRFLEVDLRDRVAIEEAAASIRHAPSLDRPGPRWADADRAVPPERVAVDGPSAFGLGVAQRARGPGA